MNKTRIHRQAHDIAAVGLSVAELAKTKGWTLERELLTILAADRVEDLLAIAEKTQPSGPAAARLKLAQIEAERQEITRLRAEKEAWEAQNPPEDEEEAEGWNYAKDLERRIKELKDSIREDLKRFKELEKKLGMKKHAGNAAFAAEHAGLMVQLAPTLDQVGALQTELEPYEAIKADLAATRARYRELLNQFLDTLTQRCNDMSEAQTSEMVLRLLEERVQAALEGALLRKQKAAIEYIERLWDKYRVTLTVLRSELATLETRVDRLLQGLAYI